MLLIKQNLGFFDSIFIFREILFRVSPIFSPPPHPPVLPLGHIAHKFLHPFAVLVLFHTHGPHHGVADHRQRHGELQLGTGHKLVRHQVEGGQLEATPRPGQDVKFLGKFGGKFPKSIQG